ncbi:MAG: transporter substrate-binding domain-containing protein [Rhodospirillales bacterium]|nr:transporter substrate-binding domain-containing protein [Rhodospirillales bacterium]
MFQWISALFIAFFLIFPKTAEAETVVRVSGYTFPPFVNIEDSSGITADFIELLNQQQNQFRFVFQKTSPNRRYREIIEKNADLILFEMPEWGWEEYSNHVNVSKIYFIGGEVYIAKVKDGRDQKFFSTIGNKSIAGVFGYHYGFAGFSKDQKWLEKNFTLSLSHNPENIIRLIAKGRIEVGVITQSYLTEYLIKNPKHASEILISDRKDQSYEMRAIISNHSPINTKQFNALIDKIFSSGALLNFVKQRGLEAHLP